MKTLTDLVYKTMKTNYATINDENILVFEIWKIQSKKNNSINLTDVYKGARVESILRIRRKLLETKTDFKR
jgi:hypothetical protein